MERVPLASYIGRSWADVDALDLNWTGFWPVVEAGTVIDVISTVDGFAAAREGYWFDEAADLYRRGPK